MSIARVANGRDWMLYLENDKVKAFDISKHDNTQELQDLCRENDIPVIGCCFFEKERDACTWGEVYRS